MNASMDLTRITVNHKPWIVANLPAVGRRKHINAHTLKHFKKPSA